MKQAIFALRPIAAGVALFATALSSPAMAEKSGEVQLPSIQIIGSASLLDVTPGSGQIIDGKMIEAIQPLSTQDALRRIPGVHAVDTEGFGFYPRITIRGIGSDMSKKVLLLEDGAPIALGPYTDPAAYYSPPIERMERIEVLKGSGSLAHGPSTIGGAINYITRNPPTTPGGRVKFSAGSEDYKNLLVEYGGTWDDKMASISVLRKQGDGWRNMPFENTDVVLKAGMAIGDRNFVGIKLTHFDLEANHTYLGLTQREYDADHRQNKAVNDKMYLTRSSFDINHEMDLGGGATWKNLLYWNTAQRDWWREGHSQATGVSVMSGRSDGRERKFDVMGLDSRLAMPHQAFGIKNDLDLGLRFHWEKMHNQRLEGAAGQPAVHVIDPTRNNANAINGVREDDVRKADAIALFAQNRFHLSDATTVTPGVRVESYRQQRDIAFWNGTAPNTSTKTRNTEIIPGIGATHKLNAATTLFAGVHKGFAPPRVQDAVSNTGTAVDLDAERSTNYEIGVRGKWAKGNYEATAFRLDFANQLVSQTQSGGAGTQLTNAGKTLNQGLELAGDWAMGGGFALLGNYTWLPTAKLNSTRILGGIDRNGNRLTYAPKHLVNLRLNYEQAGWGANLGVSRVSEQFADLENTVAGSANGRTGILPGYTVWDINGHVQLDKTFKLYGAVRNLFDKKYIASRAPEGIFPGLGRMAEVGIEARF